MTLKCLKLLYLSFKLVVKEIIRFFIFPYTTMYLRILVGYI